MSIPIEEAELLARRAAEVFAQAGVACIESDITIAPTVAGEAIRSMQGRARLDGGRWTFWHASTQDGSVQQVRYSREFLTWAGSASTEPGGGFATVSSAVDGFLGPGGAVSTIDIHEVTDGHADEIFISYGSDPAVEWRLTFGLGGEPLGVALHVREPRPWPSSDTSLSWKLTFHGGRFRTETLEEGSRKRTRGVIIEYVGWRACSADTPPSP